MPFSATRDLWLVLKARDEGARALRSFSRDIRMVGDSVEQANRRAARSALSNQLAQQKLSGATRAQMLLTQNRIAALDREIGQEKIHRASMEESRVSAQRLGTALSGATALITAAGTAMVAAGAFGAMGLHGLINSAIEYQKQTSMTQTQVDGFSASLRDLEDIGLRVAKTIGAPFESIQPALFEIFSSMEVNTKQAEYLLGVFAKAAVAGQTDIQTAQKATIGILNAFNMPLEKVNHLMDLQFQLVQEGVGSYEEWTKRIGLVTPSAVRAGQSVETMLAALAATTRMGIPAARAATAVSRAFDAMSHPNAIKAMKELGVNALDAKGKFRPLIDVLYELRKALGKLPEAKKTAALLEIFKGAGGTIEARRFLQNMILGDKANLDLFKSIFDEMQNSTGSFEEAYKIMAGSAAVQSELLANKWEALKVTLGEALIPSFLKLVDALSAVLDWFDKLSPKTKTMIGYALTGAVAFALFGGAVLLLVGLLAGFIAAVTTAGLSLLYVLGILGGITAAFATLGTMFAVAWAKSKDFRDGIKEMGERFRALWRDFIQPAAIEIRNAFENWLQPRLEDLARVINEKVMPVWRSLTGFLQSEGIARFKEIASMIKDDLIVVIKYLGLVIEKFLIPMIEGATKYYHDHEETIKQIIGWIGQFVKWVLIIAAILGGILAVVIAGPVFAAFVGFIAFIVQMITWIVGLVEGIKSAINWFKNLGKDLQIMMEDAKRKLKSAGTDMIMGLVEGIQNAFGYVKTTIQNLAANAVQWFKDKLKIGSPSKVFMEMGKFSAQGYAQGIKNAMPAMKANVTNMTGDLTSPGKGGTIAPTGGRNVSQNITIHTQELNPRRQAAELGWLLIGSS